MDIACSIILEQVGITKFLIIVNCIAHTDRCSSIDKYSSVKGARSYYGARAMLVAMYEYV